MTGRILRIELRRSAAVGAGLALLVAAVAFTYSFSGPWWKEATAWNRQWSSVASWTRYLLIFLWPIAVGAGALQGLRDHRSGMSELISTTPRPAWQRAGVTAVALALMLITGHLVFFASGTVQVVGTATYLHLGWLPTLLVGLLALVAGGWLGMGIGRSLPSAFTPPAAAVMALVLVLFLNLAPEVVSTVRTSLATRLVFLSPVLPPQRDAFSEVAGRVDLGQAVWLLGVAAAGFLLLVARNPRARLLALVPVVAGAVIAVPVVPANIAGTYVVDPGAAAPVCSGPVCLRKVHETELARFAEPGKEALRLLAKLPGAPTSVLENLSPQPIHGIQPRSVDVVSVDVDEIRFTNATGDVLTRSLLAGAGTPSCLGFNDGVNRQNQGLRDQAARSIAAGWLLGEQEFTPVKYYSFGIPVIEELGRPVWQALHRLTPEEQQARIVALRATSLSCSSDLLEVLSR